MDIRSLIGGLTFVIIWSSAFSSARIIVTNVPSPYRFSAAFPDCRDDCHRLSQGAGSKLAWTDKVAMAADHSFRDLSECAVSGPELYRDADDRGFFGGDYRVVLTVAGGIDRLADHR